MQNYIALYRLKQLTYPAFPSDYDGSQKNTTYQGNTTNYNQSNVPSQQTWLVTNCWNKKETL